MIPAERQRLIINELNARGIVSFVALVEQLGVSQMTVRRDIQRLELEGKVSSVPGGISLPARLAVEPSHVKKAGMAQGAKQAIGAYAARMISDGAVIYLDAGTTALEIARNLVRRDDLTVITNDFVTAGLLSSESRCRLIHTGGVIERENQSGVGDLAARAIERFNFDIAFVSTSSFGLRGVSTPSEAKVAVKQAIAKSAIRNVLVTDSSKYGVVATYNAIPLEDLTDLVVDAALDDAACCAIGERGVSVHRVPVINGTDDT